MDTKEVKIQVPEGYEIDKENSTFECVKFKPIKKILHMMIYVITYLPKNYGVPI